MSSNYSFLYFAVRKHINQKLSYKVTWVELAEHTKAMVETDKVTGKSLGYCYALIFAVQVIFVSFSFSFFVNVVVITWCYLLQH